MFSWLREHRRRELLTEPFPPAWTTYLRNNVHYYDFLSRAEQAKLRDDLRIMVAEKSWEGCGGLTMTEEVQVTVAAQACLLLLGMDHNHYADVESILVYPESYQVMEKQVIEAGLSSSHIVSETPSGRRGQASSMGTVILSWKDVLSGGRNPQRDTSLVLHEFAHELDFEDGSFNGVPRLTDEPFLAEWAEVMSGEYDSLVRATEAGHPTLLRAYGATNATEFFAVATECFFGKPLAMKEAHPRLFKVLRHYYGQDPANRFARKVPQD